MTCYNLGDLPGTSMEEAADVIASETPLRTIPRLPARGLGSDAVGATLALMPELPIEKGPRSWRMTTRPQILTRRVWDRTERDLDLLEEMWGACEALQFAVMGPWSLATRVELSGGHRVLADHGAMRDLTEVFQEALMRHAGELRRRFGAEVSVIIEEPDLDALVRGTVKGTSDFDVLPQVFPSALGERLHSVGESLRAGGIEAVRLNQLGRTPRVDVARVAEVDAVLVSRAAITGTAMLDEVGQAVSHGMTLGVGTIRECDALDEDRANPRRHAVAVAALFDELSIPRDQLDRAEIVPSGPLKGSTLLRASRALACARVANEMLQRDAGDL